MAALLRATVPPAVLGQRDGEAFGISLAGAQEKTALLWHEDQWHLPRGATPTTHILKLPLGRVGGVQADMSASIENEWPCAQIAQAFGLSAAHCEIARFADQRALVVERFDRRRSPTGGWWLRLPQEDMCQATATPMDLKYESDGGPGMREIMRLLLGAREAAVDRARFFKIQVLFWMPAAIDGHAKNFSISLQPRDRFSLTPLYDVLSTYPVLGQRPNQPKPRESPWLWRLVERIPTTDGRRSCRVIGSRLPSAVTSTTLGRSWPNWWRQRRR